MKENKNGITLIALVITIVILLILAGVTMEQQPIAVHIKLKILYHSHLVMEQFLLQGLCLG